MTDCKPSLAPFPGLVLKGKIKDTKANVEEHPFVKDGQMNHITASKRKMTISTDTISYGFRLVSVSH